VRQRGFVLGGHVVCSGSRAPTDALFSASPRQQLEIHTMKRIGGRDIVLGTALLTASACVIAPEGGTTLPSRTSQVSFEGYSSAAGDTVVLTARNFRTGAFEELASTVSGDTETFAEDQFGDHPALFPWSITAPNSGSPSRSSTIALRLQAVALTSCRTDREMARREKTPGPPPRTPA
jgi:hypothetical protein